MTHDMLTLLFSVILKAMFANAPLVLDGSLSCAASSTAQPACFSWPLPVLGAEEEQPQMAQLGPLSLLAAGLIHPAQWDPAATFVSDEQHRYLPGLRCLLRPSAEALHDVACHGTDGGGGAPQHQPLARALGVPDGKAQADVHARRVARRDAVRPCP